MGAQQLWLMAEAVGLGCLPLRLPARAPACTRCQWPAPVLQSFPVPAAEENRGTPVLMCHGDCDQVVNYDFGKRRCGAAEQIMGAAD